MPSKSTSTRRATPGAGAPFVGRARELELLRDALTAALDGHGRLVLLAGEAGIGKTRLAEQLAHDAEARGARVLIGRCYEGEGAPAYWPWVMALRALVAVPETARVGAWLRGNAGVIAQVVPDLASDGGGAPTPQALEGDAARFRFFDAVVTTLARAAADRPLVVLLDDIHWADAGSLRLLHFAVGQLARAPVLFVGAHRDVEMRFGPESTVRAELARVGERIALGGLDATEVAGVVRALLPGDAPTTLADRIHALTEGNPFFVDALVRVLARSGDATENLDALEIPDGVHDVIRARLRPLAPDVHRLLTVAALVGREFSPAFTARVADVDVAAATSAFEAAERLGLVGAAGDDGRRRFAHALITETLALDLPALERARLHRRIAETMAPLVPAGTASFDEVATHYLAAVPAGAAEEAIAYTIRAAEGAIARLGYEDAVRYYRRALYVLDVAAATDAVRRTELLLALAQAERRVGDAADARAAFAQAAAVAREAGLSDALARAALGYGAGLGAFWDEGAGNLDAERAALVREALDALGPDKPALRAQLLAHLAATLFWSPAREHRAAVVALGREANETAAQSGDPAAILTVAVSTEWTGWGTDDAEGRLRRAGDIVRRATELNHPEAVLRGQMYTAVRHLERGEVTEADRAVERFGAYAMELRQDRQLWYTTVYRGMRALMTGNLDEAERAIEEGSPSPAATRLAFEAQRAILLRERGRTAETIEPTRALVRMIPGLPVWRCALASALAECGDIDGARIELDQLGADDFACLHRDFLWLYAMSHLARACAAVGDAARARTLYDMLLPYADRFAVAGQGTLCDGSIARYLGLLATTLERWDDAIRHFDAALAAHERIGAHALVTATQADYATMLRRRGKAGDERRARELAEAAVAGARRLGQAGLAARMEATLGGAAAAVPGPTAEDVCTMRSDGDDWVVTHAGRTFALKGTLGVTYLVTLLRHPGREFHALDLVTSGDATAAPAGDAGEMLDDHARAAYRRRLSELGEELEEAREFNDLGRVERLQSEIEALTDELSRAVGLGGRARRAGSDAERARLNVTRALKRVIEMVAARDRALGSDLERGVQTGNFCSYTPDPRVPVRWDV